MTSTITLPPERPGRAAPPDLAERRGQMQAAVDVRNDIWNGVIKSLVFGGAVTWIAVFEGYDAPPTAEGVSRATTRTVVTSSLAILFLDFILTALMFTGGNHR